MHPSISAISDKNVAELEPAKGDTPWWPLGGGNLEKRHLPTEQRQLEDQDWRLDAKRQEITLSVLAIFSKIMKCPTIGKPSFKDSWTKTFHKTVNFPRLSSMKPSVEYNVFNALLKRICAAAKYMKITLTICACLGFALKAIQCCPNKSYFLVAQLSYSILPDTFMQIKSKINW